jgi:uncharacterized protein YkwD
LRLLGTLIMAAAVAAGVVVPFDQDGDQTATTRVPAVPSALDAEQERLDLLLASTAVTTTTTVPPTTTTAPPPPAPPSPAPAPAPVPAPAPAPAPAPPPPPAPDVNDEARALQLVNGERAKAGLAPLQLSGGATSVARTWAINMAGSGLSHNPDLSGDLQRAGVTGWASCGENVGYGGSVDQVHALFMGSQGHRDNILNGGYSQVGIGVVRSGGKVWVTMDLVGY